MTLQMRKSPCILSGTWVLETTVLEVTGRTSFFSSSYILKPSASGRT